MRLQIAACLDSLPVWGVAVPVAEWIFRRILASESGRIL